MTDEAGRAPGIGAAAGGVAEGTGGAVGRLVRRWRSLRLPRPSAAEWDRAFRAGRWDFLLDQRESARLAMAAHYVRLAAPPGAVILDVGCGEGALLELIGHLPYRRYTGVDLSAEAVARAGARAGPRDRFAVGDAAHVVADETPDVIVLNEVLYYVADPAAAARRLLAQLRPGGALVVSIYDKPKTRWIWRHLARVADRVDQVRVRNDEGTRWRVAWLTQR